MRLPKFLQPSLRKVIIFVIIFIISTIGMMHASMLSQKGNPVLAVFGYIPLIFILLISYGLNNIEKPIPIVLIIVSIIVSSIYSYLLGCVVDYLFKVIFKKKKK
jgi:hypothetical protein